MILIIFIQRLSKPQTNANILAILCLRSKNYQLFCSKNVQFDHQSHDITHKKTKIFNIKRSEYFQNRSHRNSSKFCADSKNATYKFLSPIVSSEMRLGHTAVIYVDDVHRNKCQNFE